MEPNQNASLIGTAALTADHVNERRLSLVW